MKKYNRALSLLLIICIMFCAFFGSVESSSALVLNPWTIALCGALLTAAGLTFGSPSDMEAAAGSFAGSVSASIMADLQAKAAEYEASNDNDFFLTLGADIIAAISGWLSGVTAAEGGSVSVPSNISLLDSSIFSNVPVVSKESFSSCNTHGDTSVLNIADGQSVQILWQANFADGSTSKIVNFSRTGDDFFRDDKYLHAIQIVQSGDLLYLNYYTSNSASQHAAWALSNGNMGINSSLSVVGVSTIPFDSTWSPDSEDKSKALVPGASVKLPKGLVNSDGALDSDVVGAMTPESVRAGSADIPDVIAGTGTITGTGEGTGIFEGVGSLVLDIPIIGTIASTLSGILEAIKGFFDVSRFDLNFESLKVGLTGVFPFCIPFDFFNAVKMFSSDASSFVFDINLETDYFTIDHTVDLTPFRLPILFFRYVVVFWFGFILISRTKDFMKW